MLLLCWQYVNCGCHLHADKDSEGLLHTGTSLPQSCSRGEGLKLLVDSWVHLRVCFCWTDFTKYLHWWLLFLKKWLCKTLVKSVNFLLGMLSLFPTDHTIISEWLKSYALIMSGSKLKSRVSLISTHIWHLTRARDGISSPPTKPFEPLKNLFLCTTGVK